MLVQARFLFIERPLVRKCRRVRKAAFDDVFVAVFGATNHRLGFPRPADFANFDDANHVIALV